MPATAEPLRCRTCHALRGENIAGGTRCARCGQKHAVVLWLAGAIGAANWALYDGWPLTSLLTAAGVTLLVMPPALVSAVLLHEIMHAAPARLLGLTVTRLIIGEGRALVRVGRDPQLIVGSVVLGNGLTLMSDVRRSGYRARWAVVLLSAPIGSAAVGAMAWTASADWPLAARTAAVVFAIANLFLAAITAIPVPTFGGRVWSDVAATLYLLRATESQLSEHMILSVQDRAAALVELGHMDRAVEAARAGVAVRPDSILAGQVLAYVLFRAGRVAEMRDVVADLLARDVTGDERAYLERLIGER
jgi:hypothetical protein